MLSHREPESILNQNTLKLVWFKDGIGITHGTSTYTIRASNYILNLQKMAGFTASTLAFAASFLPQVSAIDNHRGYFRVKDTDDKFVAWNWNFHGNHLGDLLLSALRNGTCNVVPIQDDRSYRHNDTDCVHMTTQSNDYDYYYALFITNSVKPTICENLISVSNCITDLAMQLGDQSSTVSSPTQPTSSASSFDSTSIAIGTAVSIATLGALAFFGLGACKRGSANQKASLSFRTDFADPANYICPVSLDEMEDPYQLDCGHNIDLSSLQGLKPNQEGQCKCPLCRALIVNPTSNHDLKAAIVNYRNTNREVIIDSHDGSRLSPG